MNGGGRPLRFLGIVLGGWIVIRAGSVAIPALLPLRLAGSEPVAEVMERNRTAQGGTVAVGASAGSAPQTYVPVAQPSAPVNAMHGFPKRVLAAASSTARVDAALPVALGPRSSASAAAPPPEAIATPPAPQPVHDVSPRPSLNPTARRWSVTAWALWRHEAGTTFARAPLLGGSQVGLRLDYRLWQRGGRSLAVHGRLTRALEQPFAEEAALGLSLRPVEGLPVSLFAERRQRIGTGARSGFAVFAAGGLGPRDVAPRLEIEGYAQGGVVAASRAEGFADGRLSLAYRLTAHAKPDIALGVALSGGAQRGASRLDIGPELRARLPVADGRLRLSAEWRHRVAGAARPVSGPALTLVADF